MLAALQLERALGKPALLEQYLNRVYYGAGPTASRPPRSGSSAGRPRS
jgi:membrane peptidoglycan carboxypeptidase